MSKRLLSRFLPLLMAALFCCALLVPCAIAADTQTFYLSSGDIVIGADPGGLAVSVGERRTILSADTVIRIEGGSTLTQNSILVRDNVHANIVLSGVMIESPGFLTAPFSLSGAEQVTLTLSGANSLSAPHYMAALQVSRYASLSMVGGGSLIARGGMSAAGIGGGWKNEVAGTPCGSINISDAVTISAFGGDYAAGIGGGEGGNSGKVIISGAARVYASGGKNAAGIGSGSGGRSKNILISGSAIVEASGGEGGAGLGSGKDGAATKISVSGAANVRASGGEGGAGIGSGENGSATLAILSENAVVRTRGGTGGAGIGSGKNASLSVGVTVSGFSSVFSIGGDGAPGIGATSGSGGILSVVDSATVETYGGTGGAGLGGGPSASINSISCTDRVSIYAYGGKNAAGIGAGENGSFEQISLSGFSSVRALGGKYGAGIGGGKIAICGTTSIYGSANVVAQGGNFGAGIGAGAKNAPDYEPNGSIYIYGTSTVKAAGGKDAAGIGGGLFAGGSRLYFSDSATVDAYAGIVVSLDATNESRADYSLVTAALNKVPTDLSAYTDQSVQLLNAAISAVVYEKNISEQVIVDSYAKAIERAISILVRKQSTYTLSCAQASFPSGEPITVSYTGASSPNDRLVVLKKGYLPTDTTIDPEFNISYGTPLIKAYCADAEGKALSEGTLDLSLTKADFLYTLGFSGLPEGSYSVFLCLDGSNIPMAQTNFSVTGNAIQKADYTELDKAIESVPQDLSLYTPESVQKLNDAIGAVIRDLSATEQDLVNAYEKTIRDAITALVLKTAIQAGYSNLTIPTDLTLSTLVADERDTENAALLLLADAAGVPTAPGWGLISLESGNVETVGADSVVSAINHIAVMENISVSANEVFNTQSIAAKNVGAGAGCEMDGSSRISSTVSLNGTLSSTNVTLAYGASIGTLTSAYPSGDTFRLPTAPICPGYIFRYWSTDENGTARASGSFSVTSDLTFYANWDLVPVSLEKEFKFSSGALGLPYSDTLQFQTGSGNFTVSVSEGSLPVGLALNSQTGEISGTPGDLGTSDFTLLIIDTNGTRTEEKYSITIFQSLSMTFTFHTSKNASSGTDGSIYFSYSYYDKGNNTLKESASINLTEALLAQYPNPLKPGAVETLTLQVGGFVGEPVQLFFSNSNPQDGYRIDKVQIQSGGNDTMPSFDKTYQINAWIGHIDDANFFESGMFTLLLVLLAVLGILVAVLFFLRRRNNQRRAQNPALHVSAEKKKIHSPLNKKRTPPDDKKRP